MLKLGETRKTALFSLFLTTLLVLSRGKSEYTEENSRIPLSIDKLSNKAGLNLKIGNTTYFLAIDTINEGIRLFQGGTEACNNDKLDFAFSSRGQVDGDYRTGCYSPYKSPTSSWCLNTNKCSVGFYPFVCERRREFPDPLRNSKYETYYHEHIRTYDGVRVEERSIEGNDVITLPWMTPELTLQEFPIKLIRSNVSLGNGNNWPSFHSFDGFVGLVGKFTAQNGAITATVATESSPPYSVCSLVMISPQSTIFRV